MLIYNFYFFAFAAYGKGISGGDRIFIEFARRWSNKYPVTIYLWTEGYEMCRRQNLKGKNLHFQISSMKFWKDFGFVINYIARIIEGIRVGCTTKLVNDKSTIVYSVSEFWMDSLPAVILKIRFPKIIWVAAWYQTAPSPIAGFTEGKRSQKYRLSALFYWLVQLLIKPLIGRFSDFILVNNKSERRNFTNYFRKHKVVVVLGAVDTTQIKVWKEKNKLSPKKAYDAVFQGRFHPQKGVVELVDIWKMVTGKIPEAKLAMIGDGPLMRKVKSKIKDLKLEKNITLFGYLFDGPKKYKIFSESKVVVHPAFYDSGGMASAEAMMFGAPCVGFDLKSYKSYYPEGMKKVKVGDLNNFAREIVKFLEDERYRARVGADAVRMIQSGWSWDARSQEIMNAIIGL